jgi:peptidoglycan/LPS O-acetylase OafA/YrhL
MSGARSYPLFDYLRMLLALGVFAAHADRSLLVPAQLGNTCVQVFFALSGFLIGGILLDTPLAQIPRFYFNRVVRVWIPYFLAVAITVAASPLVQRLADPKLWEFVFHQVTFTYNVFGLPQHALAHHAPMHGVGHVFWSVCVEEQFYLLAPLVICVLPRARLWILAALLAVNFLRPHDFAAISLGVLLALSARRFGPWYERRFAKLVLASAVLALSALLWLDWDHARVVPWLAVAIIALVAFQGPRLPGGVVLGGMSYPFYLNHWMGLTPRTELSQAFGLGQTAGTALALALALGVSLVHYQFVDRLVQQRRARWVTRARGRLALASGVVLVATGLVGGAIFSGR